MTARGSSSTAIAANTDVVADAPAAWPAQVRDVAKLLWVKRLAAETAMKRLSAKLDVVDVQFPLEGEAEKSQWKINDKAREAAKDKISQALKRLMVLLLPPIYFFVCI